MVAGTFIKDAQSDLQFSGKVKVKTERYSFNFLVLEKFDVKIDAHKLSRETPKIENKICDGIIITTQLLVVHQVKFIHIDVKPISEERAEKSNLRLFFKTGIQEIR